MAGEPSATNAYGAGGADADNAQDIIDVSGSNGSAKICNL